MYKSVKTRLELNECAVFLDLNYFAFDNLSNLVVFIDNAPRLRLILLET